MATSPTATDQLLACQSELRELVDGSHEAVTPPELQQKAEHAVACGVAELAGEQPPEPVRELPGREILAKDMLITVDLVQRALVNHQS